MTGMWDGPGWVFELPEEMGSVLFVLKRCPKCGKWVKRGQVFTNLMGDVKLKGFMCAKCGEVKPGYSFAGEEEIVKGKPE